MTERGSSAIVNFVVTGHTELVSFPSRHPELVSSRSRHPELVSGSTIVHVRDAEINSA